MLSGVIRHVRQQFVGYIALFIALGGVSYAAVALPAKSVGTKQLRNGAVTPAKVAASTIARFKGQRGLTGARGLTGPRGLTALQGSTGATGAAGTNGTNGTNGATNVVVRTNSLTLPSTANGSVIASCNPGERATGGGAAGSSAGLVAYADSPFGGSTTTAPVGWSAQATNTSGSSQTLTVYVVCASP
jgi:Collagen triple helix repeat (20 copies)